MRTRFYTQYMKSQKWRDKKQQRLEIDDFKCVMCKRPQERTRNGLQCHHISYQNLGDEDVFLDLVTLCPECHRRIHRYYDRRRNNESNV